MFNGEHLIHAIGFLEKIIDGRTLVDDRQTIVDQFTFGFVLGKEVSFTISVTRVSACVRTRPVSDRKSVV